MKKITIIGGGIVGECCAYFLSKSGHDVTIINPKTEMPSASYGNCGTITPSHIFPLNSKRTIKQGIKWLAKKDAPLYINPRHAPYMINWLWDFMKHANPTHRQKAMQSRDYLLKMSVRIYNEEFKAISQKSEWTTGGEVYLCKTEDAMNKLRHEVKSMKKYDIDAEMLTKDEVKQYLPNVKSDIIGGAIYKADTWLNPMRLSDEVRQKNIEQGVQYVNDEVVDFVLKNKEITGLKLKTTDYQPDTDTEYILSAGAQSTLLARKLGIRLLMQPGKGYSLTTSAPLPDQPNHPVYMVERRVVATPMKTAFRVGSTMEFSGYDLELNPARIQALKDGLMEYVDMDITGVDFTPWAGWRPMTSNELPIITPSKRISNLTLATGHGIVGLSIAPATGFLIDEYLSKKETDPSAIITY